MTTTTTIRARAVARRLDAQDGFTMIVALSILLITSLLVAGLFTAVQGDASLTRGDLDGKRAYAAAQAGVQYYLGQLNENAANSTWWQTCSNDTTNSAKVAVPGTTGETYSYHPVVNSCTSTTAIGTVLDPNTGLLRMEFTGYAGQYGQQLTIVADFRPLTPLSYLWFTARETVDPAANGNCNGNTYSPAASAPSAPCWLTWGASDSMNGPMYTEDQYYVPSSGAGPTFGRTKQDVIASTGGTTSVCVTDNGGPSPTASPCPSSVTMKGTPKPGAPFIPLPSDNQSLAGDATSHGVMLNGGTTTLTLGVNAQGQTIVQSGVTCTGASSGSCVTTATVNGAPQSLAGLNLTANPIVYAPNSSSCTSLPKYDPTNVPYAMVTSGGDTGDFTGACGDIYVKGTYASSLTLAAADDIVATGSVENVNDSNPGGTASPTGSATLGLVASQYVRVGHGDGSAAADVTLDAAILALNHSFAVDNYDSGSAATLTIHGAIAQKYRGPVGTGGNGGAAVTGYNKNYNYDNRLAYTLPAYLFDLQNTSWDVVRQTLCSPTPGSAQSCS